MNAIDAAEKVLAEAGTPLSYRAITTRVLEADLWQTKGRTPEATIHAQLAVDIANQGAASRFQRTAPGVFALRTWGLPEVAAKHAKPKPAAETESKSTSATETTSAADPEEIHAHASARVAGVVSAPAGEPAPKKVQSLSFMDAAELVLEVHSGGKPMHYRVITDKVLELGLVNTKGLTPEATLYAQILTDSKRRARRGDAPRFLVHGKGVIGLAKWGEGGLAFQIELHNADVRKKLHASLQAMNPTDFEELMVQLLVALGFEDVSLTPASGDSGIDVRGTLVVGDVVRTQMAVQVKRWRRNVQAPIVQQVRGSLGTHEQGLIITTSDFSKGAREEAARPNAVPVGLMNGEQLVALLVESSIGIQRTSYELIELD
jgi:restriction system protein